jgi:flagellar M-ring protein FliF
LTLKYLNKKTYLFGFLEKFMQVKEILEAFNKRSLLQKVLMGCGVLGGVALLLMGLLYSWQGPMALLYKDVDLRDSSSIVSKLQSIGVRYEVRDGGTGIYVCEEEVPRIRMQLAEAGIPESGTVGYEIFDKTDVLGTTSFVQNVNLLRALEGELARTIQTIHGVGGVRVHIVLPKRALFSKEQQKPTAAVVIKMRGNRRLGNDQVQAVRYLLASSVPGLNSENVSVLNDRGVLLATGEEKAAGVPTAAEEMRVVYETRLARMVESLLEKSLGPGKVRAEVTVEVNLDRVTQQSESYDPDSQVARSTQSINDVSRSSSQNDNAATSVQTQLPNMTQQQSGGDVSSNESKKSEDTTNYEISKVVTTAVKEIGGIKRLSVAVLVDGTHEQDAKGEDTYTPRTPEEMRELERLTKAIVGFQATRGDTVDVVNLKFSKFSESEFSEPSQNHFWNLGTWNLYHLLLLVLLFGLLLGGILIGRRFLSLMKRVDGRSIETSFDGEEQQSQSVNSEAWEDDEELEVRTNPQKALALVEKVIRERPDNASLIFRSWMKS